MFKLTPKHLALGALALTLMRKKKAAPAPGPAPAPSPAPAVRGPILTLDQLRLLAQTVGFPDPNLAAAVAMAESGGNAGIVNDTRGQTNLPRGTTNEFSIGLWQVNVLAHPSYDPARLTEPWYNAEAAFALSGRGTNWTPWSAYTEGRYKAFLPRTPAITSGTPERRTDPAIEVDAELVTGE